MSTADFMRALVTVDMLPKTTVHIAGDAAVAVGAGHTWALDVSFRRMTGPPPRRGLGGEHGLDVVLAMNHTKLSPRLRGNRRFGILNRRPRKRTGPRHVANRAAVNRQVQAERAVHEVASSTSIIGGRIVFDIIIFILVAAVSVQFAERTIEGGRRGSRS